MNDVPYFVQLSSHELTPSTDEDRWDVTEISRSLWVGLELRFFLSNWFSYLQKSSKKKKNNNDKNLQNFNNHISTRSWNTHLNLVIGYTV